MSVAVPSSARDRAELRDRVARERLQLAARPEVASAGSGRADSKERCALVGDLRPFAAAPHLPPLPPPLPLVPSPEEELAEPIPIRPALPEPAIEDLPPAARARALRLLAVMPEESIGRELQAVRVALALERCL